jgi:hypothetical protein
MGDRALPDVIPILQHSLESPETSQRAGVCLGLAEVIQNCQKQQVCVRKPCDVFSSLVKFVCLVVCL